ncbi:MULTISPECIES: hypothetical protein [unclassified Pseudomonas]|nr:MULTISPECIES: hypothetical protein [unclassified Pseudomonas]
MNALTPDAEKSPGQSQGFNDIPAIFSHRGPHDWTFLLKKHV